MVKRFSGPAVIETGDDGNNPVAIFTGPDKREIRSDDVDYAAAVVGAAGVPGYTHPLVQVGSYVGNGLAQNVSTRFRPDLVFLMPENAGAMTFKHRFCWRNNSPSVGAATPHPSDTITSFSDSGFSVGATASTSGVRYHWVAVADNGSGKLRCGSYAGNGVDGRAVTVGFQPIFVGVKRDNSYPFWFRAVSHSTSYPATAAASANNIKSLTSTGFTVGTAADINESSDAAGSGGEAYDYFALADSKVWRVVDFVGNNAQRAIPSVSDVAFALIKSLDSGTPRAMRAVSTSMAAGSDKPVTATALASGVSGITGGSLVVQASAEVNGSAVRSTVLSFSESDGVRSVDSARVPSPAVLIGTGGGVICATNNAALNLVSPSPVSIEVYAQFSGGSGTHTIAGRAQDASAGNVQYVLQLSNSNKSLQVVFSLGGGTQKTLEYGLTFLESRPYHLIFAFDGVDDVSLYVDGALVKEASSSTAVGAVATPANAKFSIGCLRSTADAIQNSAVGDAFALVRLYSAFVTASQALARYRRAVLRDFSAADVVPLEEWDAENVSGSTWIATYSATNNGTITNGSVTAI